MSKRLTVRQYAKHVNRTPAWVYLNIALGNFEKVFPGAKLVYETKKVARIEIEES